MKIAILGTRGVPNFYGGFEQFAQYLSVGLHQLGHDVYVYNSSDHPYQESKWNDVNIIHCYDPEKKIGTTGQFIYDLNCILDSRKQDFDIVLQLGYTSSSVWNWLFKRNVKIVTNMDGLEWKRTKYSKITQSFLKFAESLAVFYSDLLVSDSIGIQSYINKKYKKASVYIPYGANLVSQPDESKLLEYSLSKYEYDLVVARLEPENNIKTIIDGFVNSNVNRKLIIVGSTSTKFGLELKNNTCDKRVVFLEYISGIEKLDALRFYSNLYFHGHTVGGTNPSLLEAMASNALICAHNNVFNESILNADAFYFNNASQITEIVNHKLKLSSSEKINSNREKIESLYSWGAVINKYNDLFVKT